MIDFNDESDLMVEDCWEEACDGFFLDSDEADESRDEEPPLGILSRGPVWSACPKLVYCDYVARLPSILRILSLTECQELVEFLGGLERVCDLPGCMAWSHDEIYQTMAFEALERGASEVAQRYRNRLTDPSFFDEMKRKFYPLVVVPKARIGRRASRTRKG